MKSFALFPIIVISLIVSLCSSAHAETYSGYEVNQNADGSWNISSGGVTATVTSTAFNDLAASYNSNQTATVNGVNELFQQVGNGAGLSGVANGYIDNNTTSNGFDLTTNTGPYAIQNGGQYVTFNVSGSQSQGYEPPPPPCYQNYTRYSVGAWGSCAISGPWSASGEAACTQTRPVSSYSVSESCGGSDDTAPSSTKNGIISIDFVNPVNSCGSGYANGSDTCTVSFSVNGPSEGISGVNGLRFQNASFSKSTPVNQIDKTGDNGLSLPATGAIASNKITFTLSSIVPFSELGRIGFDLEGGGASVVYTPITALPSNIPVIFQKPFTGNLSILDADGLVIGTEQTAQVSVSHPGFSSTLPSYLISHFSESLDPLDSNYVIQGKNDEKNLTSSPTMNFTLNYKGASKVGDKGIQTIPYISYPLGGKSIKYQVSNTSDPTDNAALELSNAAFLGVRVVGQLQGQGKQVITGQVKNFSDISLFDIRSSVKQNVATLIRGMKSGDIVNGVKYIEGNTTLAGDQSYELLVVQNGNVIISDNLNNSGKKLGIVVMRDDQSRSDLGNIYVKNSVSKMQAYIYADGGLISADSSGNPYTTNTATRTSALKSQLILKGLLLTRNTIGGAIGDAGTYLLPGGSSTSDINTAIMYDLNYVRRGYTGWDKNGNNVLDAGEYKDPFVIIYDATISNNPPKAFLIK